MAGWWDKVVVPRLIRCACAAPGIMDLRGKVVPLAQGEVFELGCGGGLNQRFYRAGAVTGFAGLDPSPLGLEQAREEAARKGWQADLRQGEGEAIPFEDARFDTVVCTYTLCSVHSPARVLAELRRVLKPGGRLLFAEHGAAPDPSVARWQRRIEPVWKRIAGGCHLTRPVIAGIEAAGFAVTPGGRRYIDKTPRFAGWMEWGEAVRGA